MYKKFAVLVDKKPDCCSMCNNYSIDLHSNYATENCFGLKNQLTHNTNGCVAKDCPIVEVVEIAEYNKIVKQNELLSKELEQYKLDYTKLYNEKELLKKRISYDMSAGDDK